MNLDFNSSCVLVGALLVELIILLQATYLGGVLRVVDHPDTVRKHHLRATPLVGGLAIMAAVLPWTAICLLRGQAEHEKFVLAVFLCGAGATLVGYTDDQSATSPSSRILFLFLLSAIALVIAPQLVSVTINWGHFGSIALAPWLSFSLIAVAMAGFVNAVNMADGQNGLVTGMFVIWSVCLAAVSGGLMHSIAQVLLIATGVAFLFNMAGRVFLGGAGTYGVTFVFGILTIQAHNSGAVSAETIAVWFCIPVLDCLRLMITRLRKGLAPSNGDRDHFHHRLQDLVGKSYGLAMYLGAVAGSSFIAVMAPQLSPLCLLLLTALYFSLAWIDSEVGRVAVAARTGADRMAAMNDMRLLEVQERRQQTH